MEENKTNQNTTPEKKTTTFADRFQGKNNVQLGNKIQELLDNIELETKEQQKKREKREKIEGVINGISDMGMALSNLFFANRYAPNMYDGKNTLSAKAKERFEKAKAERDKKREQALNYALSLGKIRDADRNFDLEIAKADQSQSNWKKQYDFNATEADRKQSNLDRQYNFDVTEADRNQRNLDRQHEENQRQFNKTFSETVRSHKAQERLEGRRISASEDGKYMDFYTGGGMIRVPKASLNESNISYVFGRTPSNGRPVPKEDIRGKVTPVTIEQKMSWIGANADDPNVQAALRAISGKGGSTLKPLP